MGHRPRPWLIVLAVASFAARGAFAQSFSCKLGSPASMQPGDSITLTFSATNSGSTPVTSGASDFVSLSVSVNLVNPTNFSAVFPHIHISNPESNDPQLNSCSTFSSGSVEVTAVCSNLGAHAVSVPPGAAETITATLTIDAGTPAAGAIIAGSFSSSSQGSFCNQTADLSVGNTCGITASAPSVAQSGQQYTVEWNATFPPPVFYAIDESTTPDFSSNVNTQTPGFPKQTFEHTLSATTAFYYRVHASECGGTSNPSPNSQTIKVVVQAPPAPVTGPADVAVPFGSTTPVSFPLTISFPASKQALDIGFTAATDKGFLTVTPTSGTAPAGGTATLTVTMNPTSLPPGATTGTVTVTSTTGATIASIPVSISLVTPVGPGAISGPSPGTLILPVITHVNGNGVVFQSDVRLTNASTSDINVRLTLTPTRSDGTQVGVQTTVPVPAGLTIALNDIAKDFFGYGATGAAGDQGFGSLQIQPDNASLLTFASSRTYATNATGTFGQFVPATPLSGFATQGQTLSFQHVAQSSGFHTNLGLVEGSGNSASGEVRIVDDSGAVLQTVPFSLQPGEQQQINQFIAANGVSALEDGRIEVTVDSATGAVNGYASVLDNVTQDPYAVTAVRAATVSATRFITPGVAELNNGASNFHSDLRIYNGGAIAQTVTLTYYPQGAPGSPVATAPIVIGAGQVAAINNVLPSLFQQTSTGGSVLMTTPAPSSLVTTVRTYSNAATGGTYGQFIPGVTPAQGVGVGERGLEILQLEQSAAFRSNVGVVELAGNPAHVRLTLVLPDSKTAPTTEFDLAPNEFRQFISIILSMNPGQANTYNARMIVEVTSGAGRVTAYGSVIDNRTQDPTYVPAQ